MYGRGFTHHGYKAAKAKEVMEREGAAERDQNMETEGPGEQNQGMGLIGGHVEGVAAGGHGSGGPAEQEQNMGL